MACHTPASRIQTQASHETIDDVKQTARLLASDIADYMLKSSAALRCRHAATLRRVVGRLIKHHEIVFSSIGRKLRSRNNVDGSTVDRCRCTIINIVGEVFADGCINWGRIVTIYAFAGWILRDQCREESGSNELIEVIVDTVGDFVADNFSGWIYSQGGWDALEMFFLVEQPYDLKSALRRGLTVILLASGVLALIALL